MEDIFCGFKSFAVLAVANFANINSNEYFRLEGYAIGVSSEFDFHAYLSIRLVLNAEVVQYTTTMSVRGVHQQYEPKCKRIKPQKVSEHGGIFLSRPTTLKKYTLLAHLTIEVAMVLKNKKQTQFLKQCHYLASRSSAGNNIHVHTIIHNISSHM